ncbi:MAG TPA: hypothetical protein DEA22_10055 [Blastocatellia bacterium]|nr:hypothetical protein [Blastocatellia bacterium]
MDKTIKLQQGAGQEGFSLLELIVSMTIILMLLGIVSSLFGGALAVRSRESRRTDALTSAQAALNILSREIANSGFGIYDNDVTQTANNGLILADSNDTRIHFRANVLNAGPITAPVGSTVLSTNLAGEDVTYSFDSATDSIIRYDPNGNPQTSVVVNRISDVRFQYFDYIGSSSTPIGPLTVPTTDTARIRITVTVRLEPVIGQPDNQVVTFSSEVTLRNANFMLQQY